MSSPTPIRFFFENKSVRLDDRTRLKRFLLSLFKKENKRVGSVNYVFTSDKRVLEIDRKFLKHDYFTDIITFDLSESDSLTAEIYIILDRVRDNAKTQCVTLRSELHRYIFHGALHLCGCADKSKAEIKVMRGKDEELLNRWKKGDGGWG